MYKLIFRSNKPKAEEFGDWMADEVLPSIRKTGGYVNPNSNNTALDPNILNLPLLPFQQGKSLEKNTRLKPFQTL